MSGDDSQCYAILKKDFMQTEEFVKLFSAVMECYAEYGATQKASPKAKGVMDKVKSYALGGRIVLYEFNDYFIFIYKLVI